MIKISERSTKEIFIKQLDIQDQVNDLGDFENVDISNAIIDDSLANFLKLIFDDKANEEELLTIIAYTKAKYKKMKG